VKKIYIKGLEVVQKEELENEYLSRTNTEVYVPINEYNPATKKYVDDKAADVDSSCKKYVDDTINEIAEALAEINNGGESGE
jgi:hypothetical protein